MKITMSLLTTDQKKAVHFDDSSGATFEVANNRKIDVATSIYDSVATHGVRLLHLSAVEKMHHALEAGRDVHPRLLEESNRELEKKAE